MKKLIIPILILVAVLIVIMSFTISSQENYVKIVPEYTHSWTKAICNSENFCQDYEIFCKNQEVVKISPITGASIQFSRNWNDPRSADLRNAFC